MSWQHSQWPQAILHVDGDAFFAACEQAIHPEYRGKPVITGKERGIVSAASYEAKALGITRGVPLWEVKKICPEAIIVGSDYETYSLFSQRMYAILRRFTSVVEEYSIDEAFADITGLQGPLHSSYASIAEQIKAAIESELGITVSIGLSVSKVLAKVGSKWNKPSGLTVISKREAPLFLQKIDVKQIWGIGSQTSSYCRTLGIYTAWDFAKQQESYIRANFSKPYYEIWQELNGASVLPVSVEEKKSYASIGKFRTFTPSSREREYLFGQLLRNVENACAKARRFHLITNKLALCLRTQEFRHQVVEIELSRASAFPHEMCETVRKGFDAIFHPNTSYRATGVTLLNLKSNHSIQASLFEPPLKLEKMQRLYDAVDVLNKKMGRNSVHLAATILAREPSLKRGGTPVRQLNRLKGENRYQHLAIPLLLRKSVT